MSIGPSPLVSSAKAVGKAVRAGSMMKATGPRFSLEAPRSSWATRTTCSGVHSVVAPATSTILAKERTLASASCWATPRISSGLIVPRATMVTVRCSREISM